jgi:hypothetical protein
MKRHGDSAPILDSLGLSSGDAVFDNLSTIEGAQIYAIEAELREQYMNLVAKNDDDNALVQDELRVLVAARDSY